MKEVAWMRMHKHMILNCFAHRITTAKAERINSRITLIEKMTYGFRN
jgi:transposase